MTRRKSRKRRRRDKEEEEEEEEEVKTEEELEIENSSKSKVTLWLETSCCVSPSLSPPPSPPPEEITPAAAKDEEIEIESFEDNSEISEETFFGNIEEEEEEDFEEEEELEEEEECTAEDLVKVLTSCRVCFESHDTPANSIWCILGHLKYLCIFCFRIVDKEDLVRHTKSEKSKERCIEGRRFQCPYKECTDVFTKSEDSFEGVHHLFERLYFHVVNRHLPKSYEEMRAEVDEVIEEVEDGDQNHHVITKEEAEATGRYVNVSVSNVNLKRKNQEVIITLDDDDDDNDKDQIPPGVSGDDLEGMTSSTAVHQEVEEDDRETIIDNTAGDMDVEMEDIEQEVVAASAAANNNHNIKNSNEKHMCTNNGTSPDSGVEEPEGMMMISSEEGGSGRQHNNYQRFETYSSERSEQAEAKAKTVVVEEDDDEIVILSVTKRDTPRVSSIGTAFVCGFCDTAFNLKRRLHDHYEKKYCKKLSDKRCQHCQMAFAGFTVLEVVRHLYYNCQSETSSS